MLDKEELLQSLVSLPETPVAWPHQSNLVGVRVEKEKFLPFMTHLRKEKKYDVLNDHTVIDWLADGLFELTYVLFSTSSGAQIFVSTMISRTDPVIPTVCKLWPIAEWQEREAYDLFGILYDDHPDLRRLFLEDDWQGFPLRKDYQDEFMLQEPEK